MKPHERIKAIRQSKSLSERLYLAWNGRPGTDFDDIFQNAVWTRRGWNKSYPKVQARTYADLGEWLAKVCDEGRSDILRDMASALDIWKSHVPDEDKIRAAILEVCGHHSGGTVADILKRLGPNSDESTGRRVREICKEMGIVPARGKRGRRANTE